MRLRPVELRDAEFIISLRADPRHSRFLNPTSTSVAEQHAYLERLFERPGDFSFVLEHEATGRPEGLAAICDVTEDNRQAEWGRWIMRPGSLAALVHVCLVHEVAFEQMKLESLYCRTVLANTTVVTFHEQFGLRRGTTLPTTAARAARARARRGSADRARAGRWGCDTRAARSCPRGSAAWSPCPCAW